MSLSPGDCSASDAVPLVVHVGGEPFAGSLVSIDGEGRFTFQHDGEAKLLSAGKFVRWSHPNLPRSQTLVLLADGSRIVTAADWSGGASVRLDGDAIVLLSNTWNEVRIAKAQVRGIVFANRRRPRDREQLEDRVRSATGDQDHVLLTNQDELTGTLVKLTGGSIAFSTAAGEALLPLSRVEAIIFGSGHDTKQDSPRPRLLVSLRDGSLLFATAVQTDDKNLRVALADDLTVSGGTRDDVIFLQSLAGEFVYLSDLEPADYRHVPYLSVEWPYKRDRNVLGEPLSVGGKRYLKGLSMHSAGRLTYRLDGNYRRFCASIALDDSAGSRGSVAFGVFALRDGKWQEAFLSDTIRGGEKPRDIAIDVAGAQALTLTVDYADRGDELDHADWLDARLEK